MIVIFALLVLYLRVNPFTTKANPPFFELKWSNIEALWLNLNNFWNNWQNQTKLSHSFDDIPVFIKELSKVLKIELSRDQMLSVKTEKNQILSFNSSRKFKDEFVALFFLHYL